MGEWPGCPRFLLGLFLSLDVHRFEVFPPCHRWGDRLFTIIFVAVTAPLVFAYFICVILLLLFVWISTCGYCFTRCWGWHRSNNGSSNYTSKCCTRYVKRIKREEASDGDGGVVVHITALSDWEVSEKQFCDDFADFDVYPLGWSDLPQGETRRKHFPGSSYDNIGHGGGA